MKCTIKRIFEMPALYSQSKLMLMFILIISIEGTSACSTNKDENIWPPVPPIELLFDVQKAGNKIETEFQIIDHSHRLFSLNLNYLYNDQIARKRAWELSGGNGGWQDAPEKNILPIGDPMRLYSRKSLPDKKLHPAPLTIKVTISHINGSSSNYLIQKEIHTHEIGLSSWGSTNLVKQLFVLPLEIGHYNLSVQVLSTSPEFNQTPLTFKITFPHGGK